MLVPLSWLREFVPYEGSAEALGDRLTMLGLELDGINHPFAGIADIKVGYVAQCSEHPDSDHLHCCKVDLGDGELVDIVCGASNVAAGQKVAVAPVGARLPDGTLIKKAKLRGQPSFGMICSERELGLSEDHSGILVLPDSCNAGQSLIDALSLETDVLDLSITPNRSDCLSILGIARETAMAFNLPLKIQELSLAYDDSQPELEVPVLIEDPESCWLYSGRVLTGINVGQSPLKIRSRLISVGVRPVSNIVDITNYILFECGQPLHAFDFDKLEQGCIVVRKARDNETLITLDGKNRKLSTSDLCICDAVKPVGLAGVMGGENSEITAATRNVFLESAVFRPQSIRKTAKRLGLNSEASYRFERGIDQSGTIWALERACVMMASMAAAHVRKGIAVAEPKPFIPARISYRPSRADALLGCDIKPAFQLKALENEGCAVENSSDMNWVVIQPSWRHDLTREADIVEEIARVYGVDEIPCKLPVIHKNIENVHGNEDLFEFLSRIRHWAAGLGLHEAVNYSFTGKKDLNFLNSFSENNIKLLNPISEEQNTLRNILAPGLLSDLKNNLAFGAQSIRIFEIANAFTKSSASETGAEETRLLGILLSGIRHDSGYPRNEDLFDYGDIKGISDNLLKFLHLPEMEVKSLSSHPFLNPCVEIDVNGKNIGLMGRISPDIARNWNAQKPVWICEFDLVLLGKLHENSKIQFKSLPVYPPVRRDMTVMARTGLTVGEILETISKIKLPLLEKAEFIDSFVPENSNERNLTFRLTFRHSERTLKDAEVDKEREKAAAFLCKELGVRI